MTRPVYLRRLRRLTRRWRRLTAPPQPGIKVLDVKPNAPVRRAWAMTRKCDVRSAGTEAMLEILAEHAEQLTRRAPVAA